MEILTSYRKSGSRNTMVMSDFRLEVEIWPFRACTMKKCNITIINRQFTEILAFYRKFGSKKSMATSNFRPDVDI